MSQPLLFLDIDGVLNTSSSCLRHRSGEVFTLEAVIALNWLVVRIAPRVVVTSTRRRTGITAIRALFIRNNLTKVADRIIGLSPNLTDCDTDELREEEITSWLETHTTRYRRIVILDDKPFIGPLAKRLICPDADEGLTLEWARLAAAKSIL